MQETISQLPADTDDLDGDFDTSEPIPYDQRGAGFDRRNGVLVDIGAFEVQTVCVASPFNIPDGDVQVLIDAVNWANDEICNPGPDTINLANNSLYLFTQPDNDTSGDNETGLPLVTTEIIINGNGATLERSSQVGIDDFRFLFITETGNLTVNDTTFTNGYAVTNGAGPIIPNADEGGAVLNLGTLILDESVFSSNQAFYGSGVYNIGSLSVTNSTFTNNGNGYGRGGGIYNVSIAQVDNSSFDANIAFEGGGIFSGDYIDSMTTSGDLTVTNSQFTNNTVYSGGGIFTYTGSLVVDNSTFTNNIADGVGGGGIFSEYPTTTALISNSVFSNNSAPGTTVEFYSGGGGAFIRGSDPANDDKMILNSTFTGNSAEIGAGVTNGGAALRIIGSTFDGNHAVMYGGGFYNSIYALGTIINSTFSNNESDGDRWRHCQ